MKKLLRWLASMVPGRSAAVARSGDSVPEANAAGATHSLDHDLIELLRGHGVDAVLDDGMVHLPALARHVRLTLESSGGGTFLLVVRATVDEDLVVEDVCSAMGRTLERARADGIASFCMGTFHVLLAALWGVLERDQVDHEVRVVGDRSWDVYLGPCTGRVSRGVEQLVMPPGLTDAVLAHLDRILCDRRVHTVRLYLGAVVGKEVVESMEAVVDGEPDAELARVWRAASWQLPAAGFASCRWFLMCCPRVDGANHRVERGSCGGGGDWPPSAPPV
jgi:hypothetical protein